MELRPHQIKALENVNEMFEESNKVVVVHPTGVGKTYIALGLLEQNKDKRLMFVSPSTAILWQLKLKIAKEYGVEPEEYKKVFPNLELTTYQQINADSKKNETYIKDFESDYVVFDEAHHTAASEWGKNAKDLMAAHPETKFLGLTATPERTDGVDVVKEVFDGNLADEITLEEAVATRLLKMPSYVNAVYSYKSIIEDLEERIEALEEIDPEKYVMLKKDMEKAKKALEKADGMPEIFAKHIKEKDGRFIVFCKDIEHLKAMVEASKTQGWFDGVNGKVETLEIHSEQDDKTNEKILKRFKQDHIATEDILRILFSVEKINEGLHLDNLSGVIMLRPTKSKIIFRQQLGRTMSISEDAKATTAFDIVNNIDSFQDMHDFMEEVIQIRILNNPNIDTEEIRKQAFEEFNITDETREVSEILRKVAGDLEAEWEMNYQRSVRWREEHDGKAPAARKNNKDEIRLYNWERDQILKYLKQYQALEEQEIPEQYREKVKKLKELGLEYIPIEYKTPEQYFELWKQWTLTNKINPAIRSENEIERKIANNMIRALQIMRKDEEQYLETLNEYEKIYSQFGRKSNDRTTERKFELWKNWTLQHGNTPTIITEDEEELKLARGISKALKEMKKNSNQYAMLLQEYEKIYAQYGRRKKNTTIEEKFEIWKEWTLEHGITPSERASDGNEKTVAGNFNKVLKKMREQPLKYKHILEEHEKIYYKYGRQKDNRNAEQTFLLWKEWTLANSITPMGHSENEIERKIANNMSNALQIMRKNPEQYSKMLYEYEKLRDQYGRRKKKATIEENFELWKEWTLEHNITPNQQSSDKHEQQIADGISYALQIMRKNPEQYSKTLREYENLYSQYGAKKDNRSTEEHFQLWKEWTLEHRITPSQQSDDRDEQKIANGIGRALTTMRKNPEQYSNILQEYENLYSQYGAKKDNRSAEEHFQLWKEWTLEHRITPSQQSDDRDEQKIANGIARALKTMRKNPEQYSKTLNEYENIYFQYGRYKDNRSAEQTFELWKEWILTNGVTPLLHSTNIEEHRIANNMHSALRTLRKQSEKYNKILLEYEQLKKQYSRNKKNKTPEEHFELWNTWTLENGVTPSDASKDENERKIAQNINNAIQRMKKKPEEYKEILGEYESLCSQYGRRKLKSLQQQKQQELSETRVLKTKSEQAEALDAQTQATLDQALDEQSHKLEGPGE